MEQETRAEALDPSQQMLLELVRDGRFDAEIAVRLGVSTADVRRRVEALCAQVGVADRAALRDWVPPGADEQPLAVAISEPEVEFRRRSLWPMVAGLGGVVVALAVAAGALVLAGRQDSNGPAGSVGDAGAGPSPSAPSAAPTPTVAAVINGATVQQGGVSSRVVEFPANAVVFTVQLDDTGVARTMMRYWRPEGGELRADVVRQLDAADRILSVHQLDSTVRVTVCSGEPCQGLRGQATTRFLRSDDVGATWQVEREEPGAWVILGVHQGELVAQDTTTGDMLPGATGSIGSPNEGILTQWGDDLVRFSGNSVRDPRSHSMLLRVDGQATLWSAQRFGEDIVAGWWPFEGPESDAWLPGFVGVFNAEGNAALIISVPEPVFPAVEIGTWEFVANLRSGLGRTGVRGGFLVDLSNTQETVRPIDGFDHDSDIVVAGFAVRANNPAYEFTEIPADATCKPGPDFLMDAIPCPEAGSLVAVATGSLIDESGQAWRPIWTFDQCDATRCNADAGWISSEE